jgi:hypothetical protein
LPVCISGDDNCETLSDKEFQRINVSKSVLLLRSGRAGKSTYNFYYSYFNFPKKILRKDVEKFANAMGAGLLSIIHTMLIFEGLK